MFKHKKVFSICSFLFIANVFVPHLFAQSNGGKDSAVEEVVEKWLSSLIDKVLGDEIDIDQLDVDEETKDYLTALTEEGYSDEEDEDSVEKYDSSDMSDDSYYIDDSAGLLTAEEYYRLNDMLRSISETYNIGAYILMIDDYEQYATSVEDASERLFDYYNLGIGSERSSIQLLLSMKDRSFDVDAHGYGRTAFDSKKDRLIEAFKDDFRNDDWYHGLYDYIHEIEKILESDRNAGVDYATRALELADEAKRKTISIGILIAVIVALIFGGGRLSKERKKMKNVEEATQADSYIAESGVNLSDTRDVFKYSTTTTRVIQSSSSRSGGGGGGHSHSSGHF